MLHPTLCAGAIFEYLLRVYAPENKISKTCGTRDAEKLSYWFHYAEGITLSTYCQSQANQSLEVAYAFATSARECAFGLDGSLHFSQSKAERYTSELQLQHAL